MPSFSDLFAPNPLRATENEVFLQFTKSPLDFIKKPTQQQQQQKSSGGFSLEGAEEVVVEGGDDEHDNSDSGEANAGGGPPSDDGTQPDTPVGNPGRKSFRHPKDEDYNDDDEGNHNTVAAASATEAIAPTFNSFIELIGDHPAVRNLILASGNNTNKVQREDIRYAVEPLAPSATSGFSNRFDQKLYENFLALIAAREDAEKSREEHDKIMATRPPPTPPPEEHNDDDENGGGREVQYDEDGNEIEVEDDDEYQQNQHHSQREEVAAAPRPRKTRAQRREEEKQRKEDKKREFEVEKKEHLVACLEQKLANALCAAAIRVVVSP